VLWNFDGDSAAVSWTRYAQEEWIAHVVYPSGWSHIRWLCLLCLHKWMIHFSWRSALGWWGFQCSDSGSCLELIKASWVLLRELHVSWILMGTFLKNLPLGTLIFLSSGFILDWILIHFKYLCIVACMYWSVHFFFSIHLVSESVYVIWVLMFFAFSIWLMCLEV